LPKALADIFEENDIPVMEGDNVDRPYSDAEFAARDYGREVEFQKQQLRGKIVRVNSAISSNSVCSDECAEALTEYINRPGVTIEKGGYGVIGNDVLNPAQIASIQDGFGGTNIQAIINLAASGTVATGDPAGDEP
jgi:hypothetical protein